MSISHRTWTGAHFSLVWGTARERKRSQYLRQPQSTCRRLVETVHPDSLSVQENAGNVFVKRLHDNWAIQINILRNSVHKLGNSLSIMFENYAKIDPASFFVPSLRWNWIELHEEISCDCPFILCSRCERSASGNLTVLYQLLVKT